LGGTGSSGASVRINASGGIYLAIPGHPSNNRICITAAQVIQGHDGMKMAWTNIAARRKYK
jgi:hypothetical protein